MKIKKVNKSKSELDKWMSCARILSQSLCPQNIALEQFNSLDSQQRYHIKKEILNCDDIRRKFIPKGENETTWLMGIMVDAHIIACEYDIDPLTVLLCLNPICRSNESIVILDDLLL